MIPTLLLLQDQLQACWKLIEVKVRLIDLKKIPVVIQVSVTGSVIAGVGFKFHLRGQPFEFDRRNFRLLP